MNYYNTECDISGLTTCLCTKPFDAENARAGDIDNPCVTGDSQ
jgi:hypothetical protein